MLSTQSHLIPTALLCFESLPNSAYVDIKVLCGLLSCSRATIYRWIKNNQFPSPKNFGRTSRWNVGELRDVLDGRPNEYVKKVEVM